jgi:hypothetical protein
MVRIGLAWQLLLQAVRMDAKQKYQISIDDYLAY